MAASAALVTAAAMLVVPVQLAHGAPPPDPTDGQIQSSQQKKDALASQVGSLTAQVAMLQSQLVDLNATAEGAEQKFAYTQELLDQAKQAATVAKKGVAAATKKVAAAQREFVAYAQAAYMSDQLPGNTGTLLTADDPNVLLQAGALEDYQSSHQIGAVGDMQRAAIGKSNADATARKAVQRQTSAAAAATKAKQAAEDAVAAAQQQQVQVQRSLSAHTTMLSNARAELATQLGQRAVYNAYVLRRQQIAAAKAAAAQRRKQQAAAAALARAERDRQNSGGNSSGGGSSSGGGDSGSSGGSAPIPSGGGWKASRGREAAHRAAQWLGMPYCWAGGWAGGPSHGTGGAGCGGSTVGFDCSGLTLYAWAPYTTLAHYTVTQYYNAGNRHPTPGNFLPGDLLFWGTTSNIHHVAIYIGHGDVIQAPDFGETVMVTPWDQVESDYFGATRPLS